MEKLAAFIDESGDPRYGDGTSATLAFCCVLVEQDKSRNVEDDAKKLRSELGLVQFKSSAVGSEQRRIEILKALATLDIKFLWLVVEKEKILGEWRKYPKPFYKYTQKILHRELYRLFKSLDVTIDKFGTEKYQTSLKEYIEREAQMRLFDSELTIGTAKEDVLVQVADFLCGTKRKLELNEFSHPERIIELLAKNAFHTIHFPTDRPEINVDDLECKDDLEIAKHCIASAETFIEANKDNEDNRAKRLLLEYLLFTAKYSDPSAYVLTVELQQWLRDNGFQFSEEEFRSQVVGSLRDEGVIIGSSRKGLKIPLSISELLEYVNASSRRYITMIRRSRRALETLKARSFGEIDLLSNPEFSKLRKVLESVDL
jgi:hypothetical protein